MTMHVLFYLHDNVEILDFAGPLEVFACAGWTITIVGSTTERIKSQGILTVVPDCDLNSAPHGDIIAFFGGNSDLPVSDDKLIAWVQEKAKKADWIFSVCTGARILGKAGLLNNKVVTTYHGALDILAEEVPEADVRRGVRYVQDGNLITTAGISAGIDGAFHLVATLEGQEKVKEITEEMEYEYWKPDGGLIHQ